MVGRTIPAVFILGKHIIICMEPCGKVLFHFTPKKSSEEEKHAEIVENNLIEWMFQHGVDKLIQALDGKWVSYNLLNQSLIKTYV